MSSGSWLDDAKDTIGNMSSTWAPGRSSSSAGWTTTWPGPAAQYHQAWPSRDDDEAGPGRLRDPAEEGSEDERGRPNSGDYYYYSGAGDDLDRFMYKTSPWAQARRSRQGEVRHRARLGLCLRRVSTDGGSTWASVPTNLSTTTDPHGQNYGYGITGSSSGWADLTADLSAYSGDVLLGFATGQTSTPAASASWWTTSRSRGIRQTAQRRTRLDVRACRRLPRERWHRVCALQPLLRGEYRQYRGYDRTLKVGPYFFGYMNDPALTKWVDHFPYQDGVLINYWDTSSANNRPSSTPGRVSCCRSTPIRGAVPRRRVGLAQSHTELRLDVRTPGHGPAHAAREQRGVLRPKPAGGAGLRTTATSTTTRPTRREAS